MYPLFVPKKASRFKMFFIRIFGKKAITEDSGKNLTAYRFRGVTYVSKWEKPKK